MNSMLPTIRCTGYPLSYAEALDWYRTLHGGRKKWPIYGLFAMGYIALNAWMMLMLSSRTLGMRNLVGLFFLFCSSITALLLFFRLLKAVRIQGLRPYTAYANDRERHRFGTDITVFGDRIEIRSLRGTIVMRFADVQTCVETEKGFALTDGRQWIILRAADMTAGLAAMLGERFFVTIDRKRIRRTSAVYAQLPFPLPITNVPMMAKPLVTASVSEIIDRESGRLTILCAAFAASLGGVAGVMIGTMFTMLPWPALDMVISVLGAAAAMWLITLAMMRYYRPKTVAQPSTVRFYTDGLSVTTDEVTTFYDKTVVTVTAANGGVYIQVLNQQTLFIPFENIDDVEALRRLLGVNDSGK